MAPTDESFEENFQGTRLFVRNIPLDVNWGQLKDHFNAAGAGTVVYASISVDMTTRQSKGCGIVQFDTTSAAQKAFETMNGQAMGNQGHLLDIRFDVQERETRWVAVRCVLCVLCALGCGMWTVDCGLWTVDCGL
jgi:hypothetical protein